MQVIEDDGAAGLVKAEQLIDFYPVVAVHIVRGLDLVGGVDDGHLFARRPNGGEKTIHVVEGQKLVEIIRPVPPNQESLRLEIGVEEVVLADRIDQGFKRPRFHCRSLAPAHARRSKLESSRHPAARARVMHPNRTAWSDAG